jgi:shikimate kinase
MTSYSPAQRDRLYLTGFMGSGKSTIGPILANTLGFEFADIDRVVESTEGIPVTRIFREKGEAYFREMELQALRRLCVRPRLVISLGGGTLVQPAAFQLIRATGILVYLKMSPEEVMRRLAHRTDRPLLLDPEGGRLPDDQLRARIEKLYGERSALYESADVVVPTDETRVGMTVDRIVKLIRHDIAPSP